MRSGLTIGLVLYLLLPSLHIFPTLLDDYLSEKFDESWEVIHEEGTVEDGLTALLKVKSQRWRGIDWYHNVGVFVPKNLKCRDRGVILIAGDCKPSDFIILKMIAEKFEAPFATVWNIPNQPIFGMREDDLIAYSFLMFVRTGEKDWPLLLPMVQGVKASVDSVISYLESKGLKVKKFLATGASKRGWTTYLIGAMDDRIFAIAPIVFDNLNFGKQMDHQIEAYGWYSEEIEEYWSRGLMDELKTEKGKVLLDAVDPYSYVEKLTLPKLIVLATNDRYWVVDSLNMYFDELKGLKYVLYNPNEEHDISDTARIVEGISAFFKGVILNNLPKLSWEFNDGGTELIVYPNGKLDDFKYYTAESDSLDFRDSFWQEHHDFRMEGDRYIVKVEKPSSGYRAYFAELEYSGYPGFIFTTTMRILKSGKD
ncbi:MAG TPA: PhoPQ-activated pathogenicity protein [Thermotogales bacterium]|nr:PhoPQ-activated pathogenicity protein [Thermotogales bacterium]